MMHNSSMASESGKDIKIYRILVLKRGHDIGSLKIIAKDDSAAMRIAAAVTKGTSACEGVGLTFRMLDLCSLPYKGQIEKVLSREGVFNNGR